MVDCAGGIDQVGSAPCGGSDVPFIFAARTLREHRSPKAHENHKVARVPIGSDVHKRARCDRIRISEPGHEARFLFCFTGSGLHGSSVVDRRLLTEHTPPMDFNNTRYIPMSRRRRIYEGKAKVLYEGPEPGTLIQHFKDDATAFKAKKHQVIEGKAYSTTGFRYIFQHLNASGADPLQPPPQHARAVDPLSPSRAAGGGGAQRRSRSLSQASHREGTQLPRSIIEFTTRTPISRPMVSEEHITRSLGDAAGDRRHMALAIRVNDSFRAVPRIGIRSSISRWNAAAVRERHDADYSSPDEFPLIRAAGGT